MSKIREEAKWAEQVPSVTGCRQISRRVLLLEKAYRYQRAAFKLMMLREWCQSHYRVFLIVQVTDKVQLCLDKAESLYRQAEEL